jgi:hypothetical protein
MPSPTPSLAAEQFPFPWDYVEGAWCDKLGDGARA